MMRHLIYTYAATGQITEADLEQVVKIEKEAFTYATPLETELEKIKSNYLVAYVTTEHFDTTSEQRESTPTFNFVPIDLTTCIKEAEGKDMIAGYLG